MRLIGILILITILISCNQDKPLDGRQILIELITEHDTFDSWNETILNLHIQEPRVSNPYRYSIIGLNNSNNTFELTRNREQHLSKYIIESSGKSIVLLDEKKVIDTTLIKQYRLEASRSMSYKRFYQLMYGLPMSLSNSTERIVKTSIDIFNNEECFKLQLELKEKIISKNWNIFISKSNMKMLGLEIVFPDNPTKGERLYFEKIIKVNGMKIPRIRHWHNLENNDYSGSDIVLIEI